MAILAAALLLASCATSRWVSIAAAPQGPNHIYWTYLSSVEDLTPAQRNQHLRDHEEQVPMPVLLRAEPGEYLWIVPVCGGQPQWNRAGSIQVPLDGSPVPIAC